jgi:hypothetical protein
VFGPKEPSRFSFVTTLGITQYLALISPTCLDVFRQNSHKIVILSGAPHRFIIVCHSVCGAESKDLDGAYLPHAARSFSGTEAIEQGAAATATPPVKNALLLKTKAKRNKLEGTTV